ncbi:hypothetical protein BGZ65_009746 [Modicella reniformis]|uniref:Galactose oxidase n=1 Tax=Modicella reniformis TaxID=1440133 RepID=A0A9P6MAS9_9FUNG|nr:hypothetical protein BGZ65_009746 [Modicella reniformis]
MNTWDSIDLVNTTEDLGLDTKLVLATGDWLSPTVAIDYVNFAWYIILQSTAPLRQVILRKDLDSLTSFMSRIDLTENTLTLFPTQLLYEGWKVISILNENAPFVGKDVATLVQDKIIIITGTANSFTPGDMQQAELRGCDHAYVFSTTKNTWTRQDLTVIDNGGMPETREKAALLAVGSKIYMHGGVKSYQTVLNDFWILDTETWIWTRAADGPGPRADHTLLQYHEYLLAVSGMLIVQEHGMCYQIEMISILKTESNIKSLYNSGFDVGRSVPVVSVLPIMAYNTNTSSWTDVIRPTLDAETSFITNITRATIIIGTITFGLVLLVLSVSTHLLRKWNQRSYTKVSENFELNEQQRRAAQSLPSILKRRYLSEDGSSRKPKGQHTEVIFEDDDGYGDDETESNDEGGDEGDRRTQQRSLLSHAQPNPASRPPRRVRIDDRVEHRVLESMDEDGADETDEENEEGQVVVKIPLNGQ